MSGSNPGPQGQATAAHLDTQNYKAAVSATYTGTRLPDSWQNSNDTMVSASITSHIYPIDRAPCKAFTEAGNVLRTWLLH